ncbi:MAG: hypothetical protein JWO06_1161 [Bacteroidota bacterium]|nr:hypothetical protein [Bacteroidota bacterium]
MIGGLLTRTLDKENTENTDRTPARLNGFGHSGRLICYDFYD